MDTYRRVGLRFGRTCACGGHGGCEGAGHDRIGRWRMAVISSRLTKRARAVRLHKARIDSRLLIALSLLVLCGCSIVEPAPTVATPPTVMPRPAATSVPRDTGWQSIGPGV